MYRDPVVGLFLDEHTRQAADRVAAGCPPVSDLVKIRTRYFDDVLEAQLRSGVRQVVILGAGLDTRAVRKPAAGVTYFEIDDEATLNLKECRYAQHGIYANVTFIPGNYVRDGLIEMLGRNGFDFDLPTYLIWEGNTMYLPIESDRYILSELKHYVKRFRLSFDYMAEAVITKTTGDAEVTRVVENFAQMGAPWVTGIRDVHDLAKRVRPERARQLHDHRPVQGLPPRPIDDHTAVRVLLALHRRFLTATLGRRLLGSLTSHSTRASP